MIWAIDQSMQLSSDDRLEFMWRQYGADPWYGGSVKIPRGFLSSVAVICFDRYMAEVSSDNTF